MFPAIQSVPGAKARVVLAPRAGLRTFVDITTGGRSRASFTQNGRAFKVSGNGFFEVFGDGTSSAVLGSVADDGTQSTISSNGIELFITGGGNGYLYNLTTGAYTQISDPGFPGAAMGAFLDGYFVALKPNSRQINVSSLYDGSSWDATAATQLSQDTDNIIAIIADHRQLWLMGSQNTHVYEDSGNPDFPFEPTLSPGSQIEHGCAAPYSVVQLDNTLFFLGGDERGAGIPWRIEGYIPRKISSPAIDFIFQSYSELQNTIGWTMQDQGHAFYVLYFPAADKTWAYDVSTEMWHELSWWGVEGFPPGAREHAHRGATHVYAFGKHLIGDRENGKVYEASMNYLDDFGDLIHRVRVAPHISNEQKWIIYRMFELDIERGVGLDGIAPPVSPAPDPVGYNPKVTLQYSDDSGKTWSNVRAVSAGRLGQYKKRLQWQRLGRARDRVFKIEMADPVRWMVIQAFLDIKLGKT